MRVDSRSKLFIILVLITALMPILVFGDDSEPPVFGEVIDVRVLNLEVSVTDKDGQHVTDLGPRDFRLIVDGREVPIEYFSEIRQGSAMQRPEMEAGDTAAVQVAAVPSVTPGEVVGTSFLLFVDNFFGLARDRKIVLEKIIVDLPNLGPADRMAIVAFDGQRLDRVGNWTTSPGRIADNLQKALAQPTRGMQRMAELSLTTLELNTQGAGLITERDFNTQVEYSRKLSRQVETVVKAATATLRSMASPPGRKVMLLMSGGWPAGPSTYAAGLDPAIRNATRRFSPKRAFAELASTANLLGYTVFPIDVPGRQIHLRGAEDNGERLAVFSPPLETGGGGGLPSPSSPARFSPENYAIQELSASMAWFDATTGREHTLEAPLIDLARETGGRALLNGFRSTALSRALDETSSYYWLGYSPTWAHDDKEHKVEVEVLRKGLESRSRRGFRDFSRQAEVTMMVESNLLFSTDLQGHSLEVELGAAGKVKRGKLELPVSLTIPLDQIVMLRSAKGFQAELELRVAVLDEKGDRSEIPVIPVSLGGEDKPPPGAYAIYDTSLMLRNIPQRVALALYDLAGEGILSTSIDFEPGAAN